MVSKLKSILGGLALGSVILASGTGGYFAYQQHKQIQNHEVQVSELKSENKIEKEKLENLVNKQKDLESVIEKREKCLDEMLGNDGIYDDNNILVADKFGLEKIQDSVCKIEVEVKYKNDKTGFSHTKKKIGTGTVIFENYILTANHVIDAPKKYSEHRFTGRGIMNFEYTLEEIKLTISDRVGNKIISKEIIYSDALTDSAIIKLPKKNKLKSFPYKLGRSLELKAGNFVYSIGHSADKGLSVKEGIVSKTTGSLFLINPLNSFMLSTGINPGDSGGPVIAIRDGKYELVGISHAKMNHTSIEKMGEAVGISQIIHKFITEYEKNPLRELYYKLR